MKRVDRALLDGICATINREAKPQDGLAYMIEYAYGQPVLALNDIKTLCGRSVSPRCSKSELATWMWAFLEGIRERDFNTRNSNQVTITFQDADDRKWFEKYAKMAKSQDGTVTGLYSGLMCSSIKRSAIEA